MIKKITLLLLFVVAFSWQGNAQFTEDFEGTFLPTGWVKETPDTSNDITQSTTEDHTLGSGSSCRFSSYNSSSDYNQYLLTNSMTITVGTNDRISFWHKKSNATASETLEWGISTSAASTGVTTWTAVTLGDAWVKETVDLSSYDGQTIYFAWHYYGSYQYYVYIDDVVNDAMPSCLEPTAITTSNLTSSSVDLTWTAGDASQTDWEYVVQPAGTGVPTTGGTAVSTTAAASVSGLTAETQYEVYVRANCGTSDSSDWAGPVNFYTGYCMPNSTDSSTYIDSFTTTSAGNDISNASSGYSTDGYVDNTTMFVDGASDGTIDFAVEIVGGTVGCAIWVDWNNDLVFDATEIVFNTTSYEDGPFTGTITIPSGTANGDYRMRVMIDWSDSNPDDDACAFASTRGEVEDYIIRVDNALSTQNVSIAGFAYYPNPVNDQLSLRANNAIDQVEVMNILGQTVLTVQPSATSTAIDMSVLNQGAYFVRVQVGEAIQTVKVIKN